MNNTQNPHFVRRTHCPACQGAAFRSLREEPYDGTVLRDYLDDFYKEVGRIDHAELVGAVYSLQACDTCGLVFQRDIPDATLSHRLYEEWIDPKRTFDLHERGHGVNFYAPLARQVEGMIRHFGVRPADLKVLDLGMGWGRWCMFASAYGCETYGLEISPARIAFAKSHGINVLDYAELARHQFNMINAEQVFEHVSDPLAVLASLRARLKPDGILWIAVPDGSDIRARIAGWDWRAPKGSPGSRNAVAPLEHVNCFTPEALLAMAAKAGFRPIELRVARRKPQPPAWRRWLSGAPRPAPPCGTERYFTTAS